MPCLLITNKSKPQTMFHTPGISRLNDTQAKINHLDHGLMGSVGTCQVMTFDITVHQVLIGDQSRWEWPLTLNCMGPWLVAWSKSLARLKYITYDDDLWHHMILDFDRLFWVNQHEDRTHTNRNDLWHLMLLNFE